jgi:Polyketide cyclase / dehydrase and lipid transport
MWTTKASATSSKVQAEEIWKLWSDIATWPTWDAGVKACSLEGTFTSGTKGTLTPKGAPALPFLMTDVKPLESFTNETELPGAKLTFHHFLEPTSEGLKVTHQVTISGPSWENYASGFGKGLEHELPHTVANLVKVAQAQV